MSELEIFPKINTVIVYPDRVQMVKICEININESTDIVIPNLPGSLDDESVRIRAKGLKIGEVQVKAGYTKELTPKLKDIEDRIKGLTYEDRSLSDEITVLQEKMKYLNTISVSGPQTISKELFTGNISPDAWRAGLNFIGEELLNAKNRIAEIERKRIELREKIDALKRELNDMQAVSQSKKTIVFDAHPQSKGKAQLEISYVVYGANWYTYYEIRANPSESKIGLSYFAKLEQRTGEDWEDAQIILSTAQPAIGGTAPEPEPWYINIYIPEPVKAKRAMPAESVDKLAAAPAMEQRAEYESAPPVETGIAVRYPLPGKYNIKSGEQAKKVKICDVSLDSDFEYFIIPRITELAYLSGEAKNTTDYLFLNGEGNTYVGDDLTGKVYLNTIAPGEKIIFSFGVDEHLKVERKQKKSHIEKGGLVKKSLKYEFVYENLIKNYHKKAIRYKLIDQIPVPQSLELKVHDIKFEPEPSEQEKDSGIYYWKGEIEPEKAIKISISFVVESPEVVRIEGLM
uniref:Mucoidy inhibitor MuiA family protein n=1 Tax=candidate division WOR-3 bacterium TaxID=2052148 RepID=A0A7V0Z3Q1_UNCW3